MFIKKGKFKMKKFFKKLSTIAVMTLAMLSVFAFKPVYQSFDDDFDLCLTVAAEDGADVAPQQPAGAETTGDTTFTSIVDFFGKWLGRAGLLVAFVGGIMFAFAVKNNDAEQKQNALLTLIAGFMVAAICSQRATLFGI